MNGRVAKVLRRIAAQQGQGLPERHPHILNSNVAPGKGKCFLITDHIDNKGTVRGIYLNLKKVYYASKKAVR